MPPTLTHHSTQHHRALVPLSILISIPLVLIHYVAYCIWCLCTYHVNIDHIVTTVHDASVYLHIATLITTRAHHIIHSITFACTMPIRQNTGTPQHHIYLLRTNTPDAIAISSSVHPTPPGSASILLLQDPHNLSPCSGKTLVGLQLHVWIK